MVSVKIYSRYQGPPPPPGTKDGDRSIPTSGPLYQESEVAQALKASPAFGSSKCRQEWQDLMETLEAQEPSIDFPVFAGCDKTWRLERGGVVPEQQRCLVRIRCLYL